MEKRKKLLHVVLYLVYGGLEKIVYDFSKELSARHYDVFVAALEKGGPLESQLIKAGIPVYKLKKKNRKFDFNLIKNLVTILKTKEIDIIHSHSSCIMYAAIAGRIAGVPTIIHTEHGRYFPDRLIRIWEDRIFSRFISRYICVSRELETYMRKKIKVPLNKLTTIINGVDTTKFRRYADNEVIKLREKYDIPSNAIVIGTVCRLIPPKNVIFLIKWMEKYIKKNSNIYLVIVGNGPQFNYIENEAIRVSKDRIKLLGEKKEVQDILNTFDIFALVSKTEGTSLTILEAMSTELPVIVSNVGGNIDIVQHGETGCLFDCDDLDEFDKNVNDIIANPSNKKKIQKAARRSVYQNYNFLDVIKRYCYYYEEKKNTKS